LPARREPRGEEQSGHQVEISRRPNAINGTALSIMLVSSVELTRRAAQTALPVGLSHNNGFFFSSRRRHTSFSRDWSSDVCSSDLNHKDLGVHTEMFSDGIVPLIESGVINNEKKKILRGKTVTSFVAGTKRVYDFVHDNPSMSFMNVSFVNDSGTIRQNPKVVAINSALEIDLTGQICSDSIGTYQYSGIGGQMDFMRGAALSEGGKPIIAIPSITNKGISRITPFLKEGAGVVTTRGHAHYIVTEFGVVNLYGRNLEQ